MFFKKPIGIPQFNTGFRDLKTKVHVAVSIACYAVCLSDNGLYSHIGVARK